MAHKGDATTGVHERWRISQSLSAVMSGRVKVFNLQIYLEIISFCDVCTLSRLMRTCTTLHHHGVKVLLQDVYISSQEAMKGFYEFFRTNDFARAVYLHSLQLNFKDVSRSVGRIVATILRRATQLRTFNLDYAEAVIQSCYPNISNALGDLGALRELILNRSGKLTWDTVAKMEVPLETLVMTYDGTGEAPFHGALSEEDIPDYHPLYVFELESVPYHVHAIYPNLRHLAVCDNYPFLRHWIEACPNVACLSSSTFEGEWPYVYGDGDLWEQIRQRNLEDQLENGTWKHLEEYNGYEVLYLYLLGLPCRIPRLTLNRCPVRDTGYIDMLRVVLADAKPTHLTVPIDRYEGFHHDAHGEPMA
ncbi:hypothetical protein C8Q78DRAFT_697484 [Trametes maxima]|nr:hypothetical protein C8Q78DRAFT_697484 [Trametes maxima]